MNVPFVPMHYLFATSLLAALGLPFSVIAASSCKRFTSCAWFENWGNFTPSEVPWEKYNYVTYAFASVSFHDLIPSLVWYPSCSVPETNPSVIDVDAPASLSLNSFVQEAHQHVRMLTRNESKSNDDYREYGQSCHLEALPVPCIFQLL